MIAPVRTGARIGDRTGLVLGLGCGPGALVAVGAVVPGNVLAGTVAVGNAARVTGSVADLDERRRADGVWLPRGFDSPL